MLIEHKWFRSTLAVLIHFIVMFVFAKIILFDTSNSYCFQFALSQCVVVWGVIIIIDLQNYKEKK